MNTKASSIPQYIYFKPDWQQGRIQEFLKMGGGLEFLNWQANKKKPRGWGGVRIPMKGWGRDSRLGLEAGAGAVVGLGPGLGLQAGVRSRGWGWGWGGAGAGAGVRSWGWGCGGAGAGAGVTGWG